MIIIVRASLLAAGILATIALGLAAGGYGAYYFLQPALPSVAEMRDIPLQIPLRIYSRDGRLIQQIGEKHRTPVEYKDIPEVVVQAFLAAEDDRFFDHPGFDYQGIIRAALNLVMTGSRAQGGSTITQQLAREYFLTRDRTFIRKGKELILAIQIEQAFTKPEILALYLNKIFLGQRSYGVAAAAQVYFGKTLDELSIAEAATIAGLPAAPSRLNPVSNPDQARGRRSYVLRRMRELRFIDEEAFRSALDTPMESMLHAPGAEVNAPYVAEMARSEMIQRFGQNAYNDGYQVITTIDSRLQIAANMAVRKALLEYDRRHGFRGAIKTIDIVQVINSYSEQVAAESEESAESPASNPDNALQEHLNAYPVYDDLRIAVVTATYPDKENSAEFFLRDRGRVKLPWERIKWRPYVNDSVVGGAQASVSDMLKPGDIVYLLNTASGWQLAQLPLVQAAFVALDPYDSATVALTGGFDYSASKFNRAVQAQRQPGSSFKPFIYSAALEHGFTAATIVNDAPLVMDNTGQEEDWRPENYSNRFYGPTRLREGLVRSMNMVSLRVLRQVGIRNALNHIRPFGFSSTALPRDLALALGSGGASPWQMAEGFSSFANGGYATKRYIIDRILDADGNVVYEAAPPAACDLCAQHWYDGREKVAQNPGTLIPPETAFSDDGSKVVVTDALANDPEIPAYTTVADMQAHAGNWRPDYRETPNFRGEENSAERIISPQNAYIVYDMMRDVIQQGTGRKARELGRKDIAGKTGTSNNRRDAWFSGFNREIVGVAWVGFDNDSRSLGAGEEGSRTALPMWKDFMATALAGTQEAPLSQPQGIVSVRISPTTGLAATAGGKAIFEIFQAGSEPRPASRETEFSTGDIFVGDSGDDAIF